MTGLQAKAGDLVALGLATQFTPSADMPKLAEALAGASGSLEDILSRFAAPAPASTLLAEADWIEPAFAVLERGAIEAAVARAAAGRFRAGGAGARLR